MFRAHPEQGLILPTFYAPGLVVLKRLNSRYVCALLHRTYE